MDNDLFESTEFYHRRYGSFSVYLLLPMLALFSFGLLFSVYAKKEVTITSIGEIVPVGQLAKIQSMSNNEILANYMNNNQFVEKGQLLLTYSGVIDKAEMANMSEHRNQIDKQMADLLTLKNGIHTEKQQFVSDNEFGFQYILENYFSQVALVKREFDKQTTDISTQNTLVDQAQKAALAEVTALIKKIESKRVKRDQQEDMEKRDVLTQEIEQLETSLLSLETQRANRSNYQALPDTLPAKLLSLKTEQLASADKQILELSSKKQEVVQNMKRAEETQKTNQIISPIAGVIRLNDPSKDRKILPIGTVIADVFPAITKVAELEVAYYVDSTKLTGLKKGMRIRFRSTKQLSKQIVIKGRIKEIATYATLAKDKNMFLIKAEIHPKAKDRQMLIYGLQGRISSIVDRKTFFNYYKDILFGDA